MLDLIFTQQKPRNKLFCDGTSKLWTCKDDAFVGCRNELNAASKGCATGAKILVEKSFQKDPNLTCLRKYRLTPLTRLTL